MPHHRRPLVLVPVLLYTAAGLLTAQLQLVDADAGLCRLTARARTLLAAPAKAPPTSGAATARSVFGLLRLAEPQAAREVLLAGLQRFFGERSPPAPSTTDDRQGATDASHTSWLLAALAAYTRVADDDSLLTNWLPRGQRLLAAAERGELPCTFADAALQVHARYCVALLADRMFVSGESHRQTATARLLQLEGETWQPGRGHYRPQRTRGELAVPQPAHGSLLVPVSVGMLVATGDRLTRHLQVTLACRRSDDARRWLDDTPPDLLAPLELIAAAQLGDPEAMAAGYHTVLAHPTDDAAIIGLQLDSLLFALTGVRVATGIGVDESWQRLSPWLPPGVGRLELQGMLMRGRRLRILIERSSTDDGLLVEIATAPQEPHAPLPLVVGHARQQFLTHLGERPFRCELPPRDSAGPRPKAQHEAPAHDTGPGRR